MTGWHPRVRSGVMGGVLVGALLAAGCSPIVDIRGNTVDDQRLRTVEVGQATREEVQAILGTPSATGTLDPNAWYYIGQRTEQTAFFDPKIAQQRILLVRFDQAGVVQAIEEIDQEQARFVDPVSRTTPTTGRDVTFMEQLLGNLARPQKKKEEEKKGR